MKTYRFYIMTLALTFLFAGCSEDELTKGPGAKVGDEVQFGLSLSNLDTRTVYGEESSTGFPIYWVNGDKVRVASPQCLSGRNTAEYEIAVKSATQNYATSMTKTGDAGVQWGEADEAVFYSIYPSSASTELKVSGNNTVTTTLHVDDTQFTTTDNGTSDYFYVQPAEMGNVVMYAKSTAKKTDPAVELRYTPFSTVLEFEINAPSKPIAEKQTEITIHSLTLTAPEGTTIAGDFSFTFPSGERTTPSIEAAIGGSNTITMNILDNNSKYIVLSTEKPQLKAKMCLMPISGNLDGWKIEVKTSAGTFSKTLAATDSKGTATTLDPGKVHKIKLPTLSYASTEWTYDPANWITSLPDYTNIYLSEISLPGAWYAGSTEGISDNKGYQATDKISELWEAGVRAFAVECRSFTPRSGYRGLGNISSASPTRLCLSGTGSDKDGAYTTTPTIIIGRYNDVTYLSSIISSVAGAIKPDEYGVLVLSYADGGDGGHRTLDYQFFLNGIANEITQSGATNIYSGTIDKNTTVNNVLGQLIIKVNVDKNIPIGSYGSNQQNYLISYNPFLKQIDAANYAYPYYSDLKWKTWSEDYKTYLQLSEENISDAEDANKFIWVFSSANRTQVNTGTNTTIPTYKNRQDALGAMMSFSKKIYENSTHNVWFYFNCGGTEAISESDGKPSPITFATEMNGWLLETINAKTDASPLGIVMFNQCTNKAYNGPAIIKAIIEMNSKFYLKHADTQTPAITSAAPGYSAGMKNSGKNAINWEDKNN